MKSQKVLCCGAKRWALVLGWIQAASSAVFTGMLLVVSIWFVAAAHEGKKKLQKLVSIDPEHQLTHKAVLVGLESDIILGTTGLVLIILAVIIYFAAGVVLVQGVQNRNAKMLKMWMIIQFIFFIIDIVGNIVCIVSQAEASWTIVFDVLLVAISLFSLWVVNVYRQELLGNSAGQVIYPNNKL